MAYAESDDGIKWTKSNISLVESRGNTDNNLVKLDLLIGVINLKVLHEPDDPNPDHRYKMGAHVWFPKNEFRLGTLTPYVSADGLTWKLPVDAKAVDAGLPAADTVSEFITANIELKGNHPRRFYINADGLSEEAAMKVELLSQCMIALPERARFKVTFVGSRRPNIHFSALYAR